MDVSLCVCARGENTPKRQTEEESGHITAGEKFIGGLEKMSYNINKKF